MSTSVQRALQKNMRRDALKSAGIIVCLSLTVLLPFYVQSMPVFYYPLSEVSCLVYGVKNPTFFEMMEFIAENKVDERAYTETYVCHDFTMDVIKDARAQGIQAGYVALFHIPTGHAIVAIQTTDKGLFFIEPQNDQLFTQQDFEKMVAEQTYLFDPQHEAGLTFEYYTINWWKKE